MDFFKPHIKGVIGELKTQLSQKFFLDSKIYTSFNNLIINDEYGSTQIDHIIVSIFGIFVVETKEWSGWIYGNEKDFQWTHNKFGTKTKFQNPLKQNYRHQMSLAKYLNVSKEKIHPIVMVWGSCEFKSEKPGNVVLGGIRGCSDYIQDYADVIFSDDEISIVCEKLKSAKGEMNILSNWRHVQSLKKQHENKCPKCGHQLIERNVKSGLFIGCSNFLKCRYTEPL